MGTVAVASLDDQRECGSSRYEAVWHAIMPCRCWNRRRKMSVRYSAVVLTSQLRLQQWSIPVPAALAPTLQPACVENRRAGLGPSTVPGSEQDHPRSLGCGSLRRVVGSPQNVPQGFVGEYGPPRVTTSQGCAGYEL